MNKLQFLNIKLTYNPCEFNNVIIKSLTMLFPLYKICPFIEKLQVFIFSNIITYKVIYLFICNVAKMVVIHKKI
jgi:hypothetical protein